MTLYLGPSAHGSSPHNIFLRSTQPNVEISPKKWVSNQTKSNLGHGFGRKMTCTISNIILRWQNSVFFCGVVRVSHALILRHSNGDIWESNPTKALPSDISERKNKSNVCERKKKECKLCDTAHKPVE